jgi:Protein of unknown function (DUF2905)
MAGHAGIQDTMGELGKSIILIGAVLIIAGIFMTIAGKIPGVGKLPGDILIKKENFSFYFPLTTCILLSIIISAIMCLVGKK